MKPFEIHDEARAELDAVAAYYDEQVPGTGKRFLLAADTAIQRLIYDPSARPLALGNVRRQPGKISLMTSCLSMNRIASGSWPLLTTADERRTGAIVFDSFQD